jgi:hypothetical protein
LDRPARRFSDIEPAARLCRLRKIARRMQAGSVADPRQRTVGERGSYSNHGDGCNPAFLTMASKGG